MAQLEVNQEIALGGVTYQVAEHPVAPGMPYGQEGRQAIVYKLVAGDHNKALKVLKPRFRVPGMVGLSRRLASFANIPGLQVCQRTVLTPQTYSAVLRGNPDLLYAVLMPWVEGPTWMEVMLNKDELNPEQSLTLARSLAGVMSAMEQEGLAHCDLSGPNVLLPMLSPSFATQPGQSAVALVDVEQMFGPDLKRPELVPGGSPGYAHKIAPDGMWESDADRLSGAVLLTEMLAWCDQRVRDLTWGESYFNPYDEMQKDSERYHVLATVLWERWGDKVARLFDQAWGSDTLADCPTFGEWLVALPETVPTMQTSKGAFRPGGLFRPEVTQVADAGVAEFIRSNDTTDPALRDLMEQARNFDMQNDVASALDSYRKAQALAPEGSGLAWELGLIVRDLESRLSTTPTTPTSPTPPAQPDTDEAVAPASLPADADVPEPASDATLPPIAEDMVQGQSAGPTSDLGSILESMGLVTEKAVVEEPVAPTQAPEAMPSLSEAKDSHTEAEVHGLMRQAQKAHDSGDLVSALESYRKALALVQRGSGLAQELELIVSDLESKQGADQLATPEYVVSSADALPEQTAPEQATVEQKTEPMAPVPATDVEASATPARSAPPVEENQALVLQMAKQGQSMEANGDIAGALATYQKALELTPEGSASYRALTSLLEKLEAAPPEPEQIVAPPPPPVAPVAPVPPSEPKPAKDVATEMPSSASQVPPSLRSTPMPQVREKGKVANKETAPEAGDVSKAKSGPPLAIVGVAVAVVLLLIGAIVLFVIPGGQHNGATATQTDQAAATQPQGVIATSTSNTSTPVTTATPNAATSTGVLVSNYTYTLASNVPFDLAGTVLPDSQGPRADDSVIPITLPFPIKIYDTTFITANVAINGILQFKSVDSGTAYQDAADPKKCEQPPYKEFDYALMPYWSDLAMNKCKAEEQCGIFTSLTSTVGTSTAPSQVFIIRWRAIESNLDASRPLNGLADFEVRFYKSPQPDGTQFDFLYGGVSQPWPGISESVHSTIVAIQSSKTVGAYAFYTCDRTAIHKGLLVSFKKAP